MTFSDLVEAIKNLSVEEKEQMQLLLTQYLREERREEIYDNFENSKVEEKNSELKFSSNINELRKMIED
jgi:alpha-ketoglutarate-dependent taurine dioxygenase